jgi:type III pantothenate kinase
MNLPWIVVDVGNSATKLGICDDPHTFPRPSRVLDMATSARRGSPDPAETADRRSPESVLLGLESSLPARPAHWFVSSVHRQAEQRLAAWVSEQRPGDTYRLLTYRDLPLAVEVDYPERVGLDRLATAVAANQLRQPSCGAIIVDSGTALKVHAVAVNGAFLGGAILPGLAMAARALANNTDLLPLVQPASGDALLPAIGKSSEAAIRSGLFWGAVGAIKELIARIAAELPDPQIFITGGNAKNLTSLISEKAQFVPDMALIGIALAAQALAGKSD